MELIANNVWIGGAAIVCLALIYALGLIGQAVREAIHRRLQRDADAELLRLHIAAARRSLASAEIPAAGWTGWRKFEVRSKQIEDPLGQVCSFHLAPHDGKPIPAFNPGQFLTFQLKIPGQAKPTVRCYSLSDCPREDHYRVTIKRVPPPRDKPDAPPGLASSFFHDQVAEGDILDVRAPSGQFFLGPMSSSPVVLIGGGVGVTPMLAMANSIAEAGSDREAWFFYGVRHGGEHVMKDHFRELGGKHPNIRLCVCYSDPTEEDSVGVDCDEGRRVSVDMLREKLPSNNYDFYVCGPPPMMDAIVSDLTAWGVPEERIHTETFGPSAAKKAPPKIAAPTAGTGPEISFRKSEIVANWDSKSEHLWEFAQAAGVSIDSGCLEGNCGTCQTAILSGTVRYTKTPAFDCEQGTCLVCCCVPDSPLELDA